MPKNLFYVHDSIIEVAVVGTFEFSVHARFFFPPIQLSMPSPLECATS